MATHRWLALATVLAMCTATVHAVRVVELRDDTFDDFVDGSKAAFVFFYAPWCGHCKKLHPEFSTMANSFKHSDGIVLAKVDATKNRELAKRFAIRDFPRLKWYNIGDTSSPSEYNRGMEAPDLLRFVNLKLRLRRELQPLPSAVVELTDENFHEVVSTEDHNVLVEFYAPWCGHCKKLAPDYERVGEAFEREPTVVVAKIDGTKHSLLARRFGVEGFPTIKYFAASDDEPELYGDGRDAASLVSFVNQRAGTSRTVDGGLTETAGRVAQLDALAAQFVAEPSEELVSDAEAIVAGLVEDEAKAAKHYVKTMNRVLSKGADYVSKEQARLKKLMLTDGLKPKKRDLFQLRTNILSAFAEGAVDDAEL